MGVPKASLHPPLRSGRNRDGKCFPWNIRSPFSLRAFLCFDRYATAGVFLPILGAHTSSHRRCRTGVRGKYDGRRKTKKWNKDPQTGCGFLTAKLGSSRETTKSENQSSSNILAVYKQSEMIFCRKSDKFSQLERKHGSIRSGVERKHKNERTATRQRATPL